MSKRKNASSAREPVTATEMAELITREISARLSAGIKQINEYITKLKAKAHDNGDSQP